jgi:hypothetical protein
LKPLLGMRCLLLFTFCVALSGCVVPYSFTARPGASGQVVDARTRKPVAHAIVTVGPPEYQIPAVTGTVSSISTTTDSEGRFFIPPLKHLGIYVMPADIFPLRYPFAVESHGFARYSATLISDPKDGGKVQRVGRVTLAPLN